jgi:hypothetical protein
MCPARSLGGNSRTVFVATLNSEPDFLDESLSTCRCESLATVVSALCRSARLSLTLTLSRLYVGLRSGVELCSKMWN